MNTRILPNQRGFFNFFGMKITINGGIGAEYHGLEVYSADYVIADVLRRTTSFKPDDVKQTLFETDMMTVLGPVKLDISEILQHNKQPRPKNVYL